MSDPATVEFEVVAADTATEIFLIDGHFSLVSKAIGRGTFSVPPGIYKIKARTGKTAIEKMIIVKPGMNRLVQLDPVALTSAMPLRDSAQTHEFHMQAAQQAAAAAPAVTCGSGSSIVLVARQWTAPNPPANPGPPPPNPARGLTLRDMAGGSLVDFGATNVPLTFDPCVAVHVAVDPGAYRLRLDYDGTRRVEQTLVARPGWQTHVYLLTEHPEDPARARADLIDGSLTMRRPGEGFNPADPMLRLEEVARGALVDNRRVLSSEVRALIGRRDCPPMLALIGAHLLIGEAKDAKAKREDAPDVKADPVDNRAAVGAIVENLRASIGAHPDVEAIAIGAGVADSSYVFEAPPLFRASWRLLLKASADEPRLLPADSFGARIAEHVWGEGAWLLWLDPEAPQDGDRASQWQARVRALLASLETRASTPPADLADTSAGGRSRALSMVLGAAEAVLPHLKSLKSAFTSPSRTPFPDLREQAQRAIAERAAPEVAALRAALSDEQWRSLVKTVGVPRSRISAWLDQLGR